MNKDRLAKQLIVDEGMRLKPYRCTSGKLSIGVGRNLDDVGVSQAEAIGLLYNDIDRAWRGLVTALPWVKDASEEVQEVLANMAFNIGVSGLLKFTNTLGLIEQGSYKLAADEMLRSKWASQVGERADRLANKLRSA